MSLIEERPDQALERFVVDNDDLLELEERVGRFNIFDALGIARIEIRHSNFLAWLLDPNESHGQGALFLNAILMDLLRQLPAGRKPVSPIDLDGVELSGVEVRREWRHIDILIKCESPQFVIAIENKVTFDADDRKLNNYEAAVAEAFPGWKSAFVFLTPDGSEPSDEDWFVYSYGDIHRVLGRCRRTNASAIGDDVLVVLDHYLRLIGSRFMDDPKIDELCKRIYQNHRVALDLIFERVGADSGLVAEVAEAVRGTPAPMNVLNTTSKVVMFVPRSWQGILPAIGAKAKLPADAWIKWEVKVSNRHCRLFVVACPTAVPELRRQVIERLAASLKEFGLKKPKLLTDDWTRLYSETIAEWSEDDPIDGELLRQKVALAVEALTKRLAGVPDALRAMPEMASAIAQQQPVK